MGNGNMAHMTRSRSKVDTFYGQIDGEYYIGSKWLFTANVSAHQHFVKSQDKNIILQEGNKAIVGYDKGRIELTGSISAKWKPIDRLGISAVVREDMFGREWTPIIPALFLCTIFIYAGFMKYDLWQRTRPRFESVSSRAFIEDRRMNFLVFPLSL